MSKLKEHAITLYEKVIHYIECVLDGMPLEKMGEPILQGDKPGALLFHLVATPNWWCKQAEKPMPFSSKHEGFDGAIKILNMQLEEFKKRLEDPAEVVWAPGKSMAWIMIRSAHHMMHHASMLVYARHIFGMGPLAKDNGWAEIMDLAGELNYK